MAMTRRGMWRSTMAGGVANIWGRLDGRASKLGSIAYERPFEIKTWSIFFAERFAIDSAAVATQSSTACLARADRAHYIFYIEDAGAVSMDLSAMLKDQPAVAVDTLKTYKEIDLGILTPGKHVWTAPYESDWAIAVGRFKAEPVRKVKTARMMPTYASPLPGNQPG